ncbi:MAG: FAD-dependent oxidoreductase, partial [Pseudomonadota bacterium]
GKNVIVCTDVCGITIGVTSPVTDAFGKKPPGYLGFNDDLSPAGIDTDFEQSGFLLLPNFDTQAATAWCANNQLPAQAVKASAFGVQSLSGEEALWLPTVCQIRPPYFMQAMRKWLEQNNVTMLEHTELVPLKETQKLNEWQTINGKTISA